MSYSKKQAIDQTSIWQSLPLSNEQRKKLWEKLRAENDEGRERSEPSVVAAQPATLVSRGGSDADWSFSYGGESKEDDDDGVFVSH